jgi:CheY-like chemotaxis protein
MATSVGSTGNISELECIGRLCRTRLTTLGFQPFKIVECLSAVLAQRLLRSLCPFCKKANNESEARRLGAAHRLAAVPASAGPGCEHCRHTGYRGRVPIAELITPSDELREAIVGGAAAHDIRAAMRASGTSNMRDHAMRLVSEGVTSIEEVNRILAEDVDGEQSTGRIRSRVLIADDEPITRMLVRLLLERENFEVLEASDGKQAVDIATRERPDLMIVDLNMPEMDGYEAIATLRRDITMATLPIVVLTSQEGPDVERRVLELGADDYIIKPFDPTVLLSRVKAVFRRLKVMAA